MRINKQDLENAIIKVNETENLSGAVLVLENNEIIFSKAYGFANRSEQISNTLDTRFGIASGCKAFTAVSICQLVEKGILSFDTLLKDCLDIDFPHFNPNITIHQLLTHTSGIPDYFDESIMDDYEELWSALPMYKIRSGKDFLPLFKDEKMTFSPGEKFAYNNAAYIVLGLIVEQYTEMNFTEYVQKNIFDKCKMYDSGYFSLDRLPERTAIGYIEDETDDSWRTNMYSIPIIGGADGGAYTTASDMVKFWNGLFAGKLVNKDIADKMITPLVQEDEEWYYGYGVWVVKKGGEIFKYLLMGSDPGVSFRSLIYPNKNIQVVILANKESGGYAVTKAIEDIMND